MAYRGRKGRYVVRRGILFLWLLCAGAGVALAQGNMLPPGKWWRQERLVQELALTEEQQTRLDATFQNSAAELIDLKAEVQKRGLALRHEMDQAQVNRQDIQRAAAGLSQARARLFERELMLFVEMRSVLSQQQWSRMRNLLAEREAMKRDQRMRGRGFRPGSPGRRPGPEPGTRPAPRPNPPGTANP